MYRNKLRENFTKTMKALMDKFYKLKINHPIKQHQQQQRRHIPDNILYTIIPRTKLLLYRKTDTMTYFQPHLRHN